MKGRMHLPLAYIAASRIPGRAANCFQVMKMAEALCTLAPRTSLIAQSGESPAPRGETLRQLYGVAHLPDMHLLGARGRFGIHLFNLRAAIIARRLRASLVLSRSIGAAAVAARLGIPTIWECHAPPQGVERRYWSLLVGASDFRRLVVISDALRRLMTERHPELKKHDIVIAHDGVDAGRFASVPPAAIAKRSAGRDPARPVAGYAGHLYHGRGIDLILACAKALPAWSFIVAGGHADDIARVEHECRERGLGNVELIGFIDNAELPSRLAVADVLLMPYGRRVLVSGGRLDTVQWMSPLKMFEYMAMGRAIISSDLPVLREVLDDTMARLVAPDDVAAWTAALSGLESDVARAPLARAARVAAAQYDWRQRCIHMLEGLWPVSRIREPGSPCVS